jgi:hypothetical protein
MVVVEAFPFHARPRSIGPALALLDSLLFNFTGGLRQAFVPSAMKTNSGLLVRHKMRKV